LASFAKVPEQRFSFYGGDASLYLRKEVM
jgi:hypothetical protein